MGQNLDKKNDEPLTFYETFVISCPCWTFSMPIADMLPQTHGPKKLLLGLVNIQ